MRIIKLCFAIFPVLYATVAFAQEYNIPCYVYLSSLQMIDSLNNNEMKFDWCVRYISETEQSVGPIISIDTNEDCRFITLRMDSVGNWYVKSGDSFFIFYDVEKDYLADCSMSNCEKTILSKRHQLIVNTEHLYPFEIMFWGVTSCDTPTYLFHNTFGIVGIQDIHGVEYLRKDFLEYILQTNKK